MERAGEEDGGKEDGGAKKEATVWRVPCRLA